MTPVECWVLLTLYEKQNCVSVTWDLLNFCSSKRKSFGVGDSKSDVPASKNAPSGNLRHVLLQLKSVSLNLLSFLVCGLTFSHCGLGLDLRKQIL